ncbi:MAG: magnesium transporter [Firmicutes bacterium]|nr:magnesium transporter [Bacillota bacterium]
MSIQQTLEKILRKVKEGMHPSDLVDLVEELTGEQKIELFELLSDEKAALIIQEMEDFDQVSLLKLLTAHRASAILKEMAIDDAADLVGELPPEEARELLALIEEEAEEIRGLLKYPEDTAGGIMTTEFISLPEYIPVEEAIIRLREVAPDAETIYYVYIVDSRARLNGVLSLRDLIAAQDGIPLKEIMYHNVISVTTDMDQEDVARIVARYDLLAVPVVDEKSRLLGIITVDDILDVIEAEATEDIYRLAGAGEIETVGVTEAPAIDLARKRLPWLLICLFGGLLSGSVVGAFTVTLETIVVLAAFIPVIMDMGGNVATQSSTVFVRGLATGEIKGSDTRSYLGREIKVGLLMGLFNGAVIALAAYLWKGLPILGLVVGIAMFFTIVVAALIGTVVPIIFNYYGIDPALSAGPFVTTIKDVTGLLIYFYTASIFLKFLV